MMRLMLYDYQPHFHHVLGRTRHTLARGISRVYYWSFEDALWDVLLSFCIPKHAVILIPNFYCMDVVNNMRSHGYRPIMYPLDKNFQVSPSVIDTYIKRFRPHIVFVFHVCGIASNILSSRVVRTYMNHGGFVIEDAVHRLLTIEHIKLLHPHHIIIDSLRKVSPLPGSFLYGTPKQVAQLHHGKPRLSAYTIYTTFTFVLYSIGLHIASFLSSGKLAHTMRARILQRHDDVIGDEHRPHHGMWGVPFLHTYVQADHVKSKKMKQVALYETLCKKFHIPVLRTLVYESEISMFPLVFPARVTQKLSNHLRSHHMPITHKFPDAPWSKTYGVIFLPLGQHVRAQETVRLCKEIGRFLTL